MIQGSVYIVTGGVSGLGAAAAELLLQEGANVAVLDLQLPSDDSPLNKYEGKTMFCQVDVTSEKDIHNAMDATKRKFGKLNGVIHCAGIYVRELLFNPNTNESHSLHTFSKVINVNLIGTFNVTRLAVPFMIDNEPNEEGERGIIINTSSIFGHTPGKGFLAYSASKAGIIALSGPMARELEKYGIRILDIAPGFMDTPMTRQEGATEGSDSFLSFPKRKGTPEEFARVVKAAIQNVMFNGTSIRMDGALKLPV